MEPTRENERYARLPHDVASSYEAAHEILTRLIGHAITQIERENQTSTPEPEVIKLWTRRRDQWAKRRRDLRPTNIADIHQVLNEDGSTLRSFQKQAS